MNNKKTRSRRHQRRDLIRKKRISKSSDNLTTSTEIVQAIVSFCCPRCSVTAVGRLRQRGVDINRIDCDTIGLNLSRQHAAFELFQVGFPLCSDVFPDVCVVIK